MSTAHSDYLRPCPAATTRRSRVTIGGTPHLDSGPRSCKPALRSLRQTASTYYYERRLISCLGPLSMLANAPDVTKGLWCEAHCGRRSSMLVMRGQRHIIRSRLGAGQRQWGKST
jgi:hypothetical protein